MEDRASVAVTDAARAQAPIIQNLMQLYTHDFSEFWGGTARGDLNAEGLFDALPLGGLLVSAKLVGAVHLVSRGPRGLLPGQR